jgi:hypothetical protein
MPTPGPVAYHVHDGSLVVEVISTGLVQVTPWSFELATHTVRVPWAVIDRKLDFIDRKLDFLGVRPNLKTEVFPAPEIFLSKIFLSNLGIGTGRFGTGRFFAADICRLNCRLWCILFGGALAL